MRTHQVLKHIARSPVADMRFHDSTSLVTNGYWAPEYVNNGDELTLKYDIYSFGIVMLELITGCKPIEDSSLGPQRTLEHSSGS